MRRSMDRQGWRGFCSTSSSVAAKLLSDNPIMTDAPLVDAIVTPFIESAKRDGFNGVRASALLRLQPNPEKLRASLTAFIRDGQVTAVFSRLSLNMHIKRFPDPPVDEQQGAHQRRLRDDPSAIFRDDFVARAIAAEDEDCPILTVARRRLALLMRSCLPALRSRRDTCAAPFRIDRRSRPRGIREAGSWSQLTWFQMMTFFVASSPGAGATLP
jgi:hypothetical protein